MSLAEEILAKCFKIKNYIIESVKEYDDKIVLEISRNQPHYCRKCGGTGKHHDGSEQEFLIGSLNLRPIYARAKIWRIHCPDCGVITERHGISDGKKRYSNEVEKAVLRYTEKLDNESTSELFGVSNMTIYRIDFGGLEILEGRYLEELPEPKALCVDEAAYKRRHRYATIISDYKASKVLWIEKGRKQVNLEGGYDTLMPGLDNVEAVSMDLWKAFENGTASRLPKAKIVYDKFHIARLLNRAIESERRQYQRELSDDERKRMKKYSRWVLLKRDKNLTDKNRHHLEELKQVNQPLYEVYLLKESFLSIFEEQVPLPLARQQIFQWIRTILKTDYDCLKRFARSILKRMRNILNWFKNPISNGKAEGINNVIKTLLKRAYGYKNFDYFRLKVLQKCGYLMNYLNP